MEPTLKQIEYYNEMRRITEKHHMYPDQIMAIAVWVDKHFSPKKKVPPELVTKISVKDTLPVKAGWYDTDGGNLYWFPTEKEWSCRDDRVSEEYPSWWLKPIIID